MKTKQVAAAFGLLAILQFISSAPPISGNMQIAWFITSLFEIIAACILIKNLQGNGKTGAILFLVGLLFHILIYPIQGISSLIEFQQSIDDLGSGNFFNPDDFLGAWGGGNPLESLLEQEQNSYYIFKGSFSWEDISIIGTFLFLISSCICWLTYSPFERMRPGIILVLVSLSIQLLWHLFTCLIEVYIPWPLTYVVNLFLWIIGFLVTIGYLLIAGKTPTALPNQIKIRSLITFAMGLTYTWFCVINASYTTIFLIFVGSILLLIGNGNIRGVTTDKRGTGAIIAYGILMLIACLPMLIPTFIGKLLAFILQLPAMIVVGVGLIKFKSNPVFYKNCPTGMNTLGVSAFLLIGGLITAIPFEKVSGFIFCILFIPMILTAFYNMLKAALPTEIITIEKPVTQPVTLQQPPKQQAPQPRAYSSNPNRYMPGYTEKEEPYTLPESNSIEEKQPVIPPTPTHILAPPVQQTVQKEEASRSNYILIGVIAGIILIAGAVFAYLKVGAPDRADKNAPRYYTFINTNLRSSRLAGTDANLLTVLPYGTELITYEQDKDWTQVKYNNIKGYIASPFLLPANEFYLLNSIFGDNESRDCIETAKCRMALLQYYKEKRLYGNPDKTKIDHYPGHESNWQVFARSKEMKPNVVFYPRVFNAHSKYTDFAVIIKNTVTGERKLLIFTFDDETEAPRLIHEDMAPDNGYIKSIRTTSTYYSRNNIQVEYGY